MYQCSDYMPVLTALAHWLLALAYLEAALHLPVIMEPYQSEKYWRG